jgi:MipA family protein
LSSKMKNTSLIVLSALIVRLALPNGAQAADVNAVTGEPGAEVQPEFDGERFGGFRGKLHDWQVVVGAGAMYSPKFEGSEDMEIVPVPFLSATFGDIVHITPLGLTVDVYKVENFTISAKGGYEFGRDEGDSKHLRGLGDIDGGGVFGGVIAYQLGPLELKAEIDKTFGGSDGLTGKLGAEVSHFWGQFIFSAGASATWADENHMESYFGVTRAQSTKSGLAEYDAGAGFKRIDLTASATYMASENWFVRGQAELGILTGDAKDSPIVQKTTQPSVMMFVGYKF